MAAPRSGKNYDWSQSILGNQNVTVDEVKRVMVSHNELLRLEHRRPPPAEYGLLAVNEGMDDWSKDDHEQVMFCKNCEARLDGTVGYAVDNDPRALTPYERIRKCIGLSDETHDTENQVLGRVLIVTRPTARALAALQVFLRPMGSHTFLKDIVMVLFSNRWEVPMMPFKSSLFNGSQQMTFSLKYLARRAGPDAQ